MVVGWCVHRRRLLRVRRPGPTATERSVFGAQLASRDLTNAELALRLAASVRADSTIGEVTRLYTAFFGRRPDTAGLNYWVGRLRAGASATSVAQAYGATAEFRRQYDGLSNAAVVDRAYLRTLSRPAEASGRAYWIGRLDAGLSRAGLVQRFAQSAEFRVREAGHVTAATLTLGLLGRAPSAEEWTSAGLSLARALLASDELFDRVT